MPGTASSAVITVISGGRHRKRSEMINTQKMPPVEEPDTNEGDTPPLGMEPVAAALSVPHICAMCGGLGEIKAYMSRDDRQCHHCQGTGFVYLVQQ